jgi:hypothetical protein
MLLEQFFHVRGLIRSAVNQRSHRIRVRAWRPVIVQFAVKLGVARRIVGTITYHCRKIRLDDVSRERESAGRRYRQTVDAPSKRGPLT